MNIEQWSICRLITYRHRPISGDVLILEHMLAHNQPNSRLKYSTLICNIIKQGYDWRDEDEELKRRGGEEEEKTRLPGCAAPLYVSLQSEGTTKPGDPRQRQE